MRFFNVLDLKKKTRLPASKQFSHENQIKRVPHKNFANGTASLF